MCIYNLQVMLLHAKELLYKEELLFEWTKSSSSPLTLLASVAESGKTEDISLTWRWKLPVENSKDTK